MGRTLEDQGMVRRCFQEEGDPFFPEVPGLSWALTELVGTNIRESLLSDNHLFCPNLLLFFFFNYLCC